jgi:hypothetical protein
VWAVLVGEEDGFENESGRKMGTDEMVHRKCEETGVLNLALKSVAAKEEFRTTFIHILEERYPTHRTLSLGSVRKRLLPKWDVYVFYL